jgi:DNA-directed RNA polymerase subunit RPC12/RpoP
VTPDPVTDAAPAATPTAAKVRKYPCPQCGADIAWHPGAAKLRCDYCGFARDVAASDDPAVRERPLAEELARPRDLGWGLARKRYRCNACGAVETLEAAVAATACAFCGTPSVVEAPARDDLVRPAGVLPFRVDRRQALERFRAWLASLWFRPSDLRQRAELHGGIQGVYVPFWAFDAATVSRWRAEAGRRLGVGKNARVVWRPVSGVLEHFFDDLPVPASTGLDAADARALEPFPTAELVPYDPAYLAGFVAEEYQKPLDAAWREAKERMDETLRAACRAEVPGDLCRNLRVETTWSALAVKSGLLPVWIAAYRYRGRGFAYRVNGATGKAAGKAPWSWWKIGAALAAVALALALLGRLG